MTLYDSAGAILQRSAELATRCAADSDDPAISRELTQMARVLGRIAAMWPGMFSTLQREIEILSTARTDVQARITSAGGAAPELPADLGAEDPLERYRAELIALDTLSRRLHELLAAPDGQWAEDALRTVRRAISDSADVQGPIVDAAFAVR
jgi:hypothetical protein